MVLQLDFSQWPTMNNAGWHGALHVGQLLTHSKMLIAGESSPALAQLPCGPNVIRVVGLKAWACPLGVGMKGQICAASPPHTHISQASPSPLLCSFVGGLHLLMTQTKRQSLQENNVPRRWSPGLWDLTAATEAGSPTLSFGWKLALVHQGVCSMLRIKGRRDNEVEQKIELEGLCCVCVGGGMWWREGGAEGGEGWSY